MRTGSSRFLTKTCCVALLSVATLCGNALAQSGKGGAGGFPDEWYFLNNGKRYDTLQALEGKPAAELSIASWIGTETTIAGSKGKVIVVDFWATWCGPCMASIPHNVELVKHYADQGLVFIGVHDSNSGWDKADAVVKDKGINYPVGVDKAGGQSTKDYGLQFWPTYVVIDRNGVVRAAGLTPDKVENVVKVLIAEQGSGGGSAKGGAAEFGPEFYLGGANRPKALRELEGKPAPAIKGTAWTGADRPTGEGENGLPKNNVSVLTFFSPSLAFSMNELGKLVPLEKDLATQGVSFIAICDGRGGDAGWTKAQEHVKAKKLPLAVMQDATVTKTAGTGPATTTNITAAAYGVEYYPVTVIVDRSGKVRAAGVKPDKIKTVVEKLLGEAAGDKPAAPAKPGDEKPN